MLETPILTFKIFFRTWICLCLWGSAPLFAQDWAQLNKFQKANQQLGSPKKNENRIVFMGNSITEGWLQTRPQFFEGKPFINRGISGQTTPQMLLRFRQDVIALQPKAVIILAGTNDIAGNTGPITIQGILDNIKSMCELAQSNGIDVILCSVLPAEEYPWQPGKDPKNKIPALNRMLQAYAEEQGVFYLDYFSALANKKNGLDAVYSYDGVHLTKAGYAFIEPMLEQALTKIGLGR